MDAHLLGPRPPRPGCFLGQLQDRSARHARLLGHLTWDLYSAVLPFYDTRPGLVATAFPETDIFAPSSRIGPYTSTPWADVLILVSREAAAALFLSPKTIEFHLAHIYRKLGVRTRTQLAALAAKRGWLARPHAATNQD